MEIGIIKHSDGTILTSIFVMAKTDVGANDSPNISVHMSSQIGIL